MFVRNAPAAADFAKAHGQPEKETVLVGGVSGRVRSTAHDRDGERDVRARGDGKLLEVESSSGFVILKHQTPGLFVCRDPLSLQGRR